MIRKSFAAALVGVFVALGSTLTAQQPPADALDGVDPVLLLKTGKETFGKSTWKSVHGTLTYLFASAETKAEFDAAPEKYAVQLNGQCARMGGAVGGNPSNYAVVDGRIYVFGSDECRTKFLADPARYIPRKAPPMPSSAEAVSRGHRLLDRAVAAHGGPKLDSLTTYVESFTIQPPSGSTASPRTLKQMWRFPDAARTEQTFTLRNGRKMTIASLVLPGGAWSGPMDSTEPLAPVNPAGTPELELGMGRQLIPLLRNRTAAGAQIASLGTGTVEGTAVERVRVKRGGIDVTLNIDPSSGRVHSLSYVDRNSQGAFGDYTVVLSDYRDVGGVQVPFVEQASYNGAPDPQRSRTLDSADLNPTLDAQLFQRPTAAAAKGK